MFYLEIFLPILFLNNINTKVRVTFEPEINSNETVFRDFVFRADRTKVMHLSDNTVPFIILLVIFITQP